MSKFDEWFEQEKEKYPLKLDCISCKKGYKAGAQSRQSEIDNLKQSYHGASIGHDVFIKQLKERHKAEIDELKSKLDTAESNLKNAFKTIEVEHGFNDELLKRIDEIKKHIENEKWFDEYGDYHCSVIEIIEILKGTTNEQ